MLWIMRCVTVVPMSPCARAATQIMSNCGLLTMAMAYLRVPPTPCSCHFNAPVTAAPGPALASDFSVAKGFVDAMGGTIRAEDTPGGGLTIVISLPAS